MRDFGFLIFDFGWKESAGHPARRPLHAIQNHRSKIQNRCAFTLTEILIVIALIVLMLALAVPAFNIIRGSRSTDSAQNQVAAMIGHARADAIGLQKIHGVMFFIDPATNRVNAAEVTEADYPDKGGPTRDVYLDIDTDTDFLALPQGVLAFTLSNGQVNASNQRTSDAYIGYNATTPSGGTSIQYGGVILFDAFGQLTSRTYGFRTEIPGASPGSRVATPMQFLLTNNYAKHDDPTAETGIGTGMQFVDAGQATSSYAPPLTPPTSALGFVLCDEQAFKGAGGNMGDPLLTGASYATTEQGEETWLDANSSQLIINRYNGTLTQAD